MSSKSGSELIEYDSECYEVECIKDRKILRGKKHYLIKWKDWAEEHNTWEPIENLQTVLGMVSTFQKQYQQGLSGKKDNDKVSVSNKSQQSEVLKKTKQIQKQKQKRKRKIQEEVEPQQSESDVVEIVEPKQKETKKDVKIQFKKSNSQSQISIEKERQATKEKEKQLQKSKASRQLKQKQKQKEKEKQRLKQIASNTKRNEQISSASMLNNNKASSILPSALLSKLPPKTSSQTYNNSSDNIQITRINYHIMIPPELPHLPAKLFYNISRRNKITKKSLAFIDVTSDQLLAKHPEMIVHYLENFVKEVEFYSYQRKEFQNRQNLQNQSHNSGAKKNSSLRQQMK